MKTITKKVASNTVHHLTRSGATVSAYQDSGKEFRRVYSHTFKTVSAAKAWFNKPGENI